MVNLLDLPPELLPHILAHLVRPQHIALASRVNKVFYSDASRHLYDRISIFSWHKEGKLRVVQLFTTLSTNTILASYVHRLELREFPKADLGIVLPLVLSGLRNCVSIRSCTWTRDGSLDTSLLEALSSHRTLKELEINGRNQGNYDPGVLVTFSRLEKLSLIMPSPEVVRRLNRWTTSLSGVLRSLTLICKSSPIITDELLESLAPNLSALRHLNLTGCPRVTQKGVWAIFQSNTSGGLISLGLEGVSPKFDMPHLSALCASQSPHPLSQLRSITLTLPSTASPPHSLGVWLSSNLKLLESSERLEHFHIYSTSSFSLTARPTGSTIPGKVDAMDMNMTVDKFLVELVARHYNSLLRVSIHRRAISLNVVETICRQCPKLEQLFIVIAPEDLHRLGPRLFLAHTLRTIHINYPVYPYAEEDGEGDHEGDEEEEDAVDLSSVRPVMTMPEALEIVKQCSPTLTQFGCNARVWQVVRTVQENPSTGEIEVVPTLGPYESPEVPEAFLVVLIGHRSQRFQINHHMTVKSTEEQWPIVT